MHNKLQEKYPRRTPTGLGSTARSRWFQAIQIFALYNVSIWTYMAFCVSDIPKAEHLFIRWNIAHTLFLNTPIRKVQIHLK